MIEQVAKNIYCIQIPLPNNPLKALNSYLIRGEDYSVMVDTGFRIPECKEALLAGLAELGVDPREIDYFITHFHSDHSGLATELVGEGHVVYISRVDLDWLLTMSFQSESRANSIDRLLKSGVPQVVVDEVFGKSNKQYAINISHPSYYKVSEGFKLVVGEYCFECIHTPGHTPGHMCLWEPNSRLMLTGDHVLFDITPNITQWHGVPNSLGDYMESLIKIREYPVRCALPGHRGTGDFHKRVDNLLFHHKQRLDEVLRIVGEKPGQTAYEIAGKMTWSIRAKNWESFPNAQKYFAVGECMAHLDYLLESGVIRKIEGEECIYYSVR